jgi:hypothetical protein
MPLYIFLQSKRKNHERMNDVAAHHLNTDDRVDRQNRVSVDAQQSPALLVAFMATAAPDFGSSDRRIRYGNLGRFAPRLGQPISGRLAGDLGIATYTVPEADLDERAKTPQTNSQKSPRKRMWRPARFSRHGRLAA